MKVTRGRRAHADRAWMNIERFGGKRREEEHAHARRGVGKMFSRFRQMDIATEDMEVAKNRTCRS